MPESANPSKAQPGIPLAATSPVVGGRESQGARASMLAAVRSIVGASPSSATVAAEWASLPRAYQVGSAAAANDVLHRLVQRLHDYDAEVYRVDSGQVAATVRHILQSLQLQQVLVPAGLDPAWCHGGPVLPTESVKGRPEAQPIAFVEDSGFAPHELDRFAAVLTASTLAIAETGTLVLQNLPGQGRRAATLVPDVHLCVVQTADVVATVPEAMRRLQATAALPTTFISGPSATADIEMTRIKGVHGPRFLHVLLVV